MAKSAPKAPDYEAAAAKQAESSKEVTEQQTWANRPDQYTPWGSTTWSNDLQWDDATQQYLNKWSQQTLLDPEAQAALDSQMRLTTDKSQLAESMTGRMQGEYGEAMNWDNIRAGGGDVDPRLTDSSEKYRKEAEDAIYGQWADRAKPEQARATEDMRTQLYNMGLSEGDPAYNREMERLSQQQGDAQRQAQYQATIGSGQEAQRTFGMDAQANQQNFGQEMDSSKYATQQRQQELTEAMTKRGWTLNEINAILNGQQVGMPSMPQFSQAQRSEGNQALSAAQMTGQAELDRYNAQQQATQGMMSGIGSMAGGAGSMMNPSDRRFKKDIKRIGKTDGGTPLYSYRYLGGGPVHIGVMADEVPDAAVNIRGYLFVDYSKVK